MSKTFVAIDSVTAADDIASRSCAEVLHGLTKKITLFTPALLITHGKFDRDPVIEFDALFPADSADSRPFCIDLKRDKEFFFRGLGLHGLPGRKTPINWDKRLYGIQQERAEECFAFLSGIAFSDLKNDFFASTFAYDLNIADPTSKLNEILSVKIFGVVSNKFVAMLQANAAGPPQAQQVPMASGLSALNFMRQKGILSNFTGDDPFRVEG